MSNSLSNPRCRIPAVKSQMSYPSCQISNVKYRLANPSCQIPYVKCQMSIPRCQIPILVLRVIPTPCSLSSERVTSCFASQSPWIWYFGTGSGEESLHSPHCRRCKPDLRLTAKVTDMSLLEGSQKTKTSQQ